MRLPLVFTLLAGLALMSVAGSSFSQWLMPDPVDEAVVDSLRAELGAGEQELADNDAAAAARRFDRVIDAPGFAVLESRERYSALLRAGIAALDLGQAAKAHPLLVRACAFDEAEGTAWHLRLRAAYATDALVDSALTLKVIARRWPQTLDQVREQAILDIARRLEREPAQREARVELLSALFDANWTNEGLEPDFLWFDYVRALVARKDLARATEVAARIRSAEMILALRIDKRFDALVRARKGSFDIERSMKREHAWIERLRASHPDRLKLATYELYVNVRDGHPQRALELADAVIARFRSDGEEAYADADEYIWILDERARALQRLGRWDDAVAQLGKAARRPENGGVNVSQVINLGRLLARMGRIDEVEPTMEEVDGMSAYGRMQLGLNLLMVAATRGDETAVDAQLERMRADRTEAMGTWQAALVQAGRLDEAARLLIERLGNEEWRNDALLEMQDYAAIPEAPRDVLHRERWQAILARSDVRKALDAVGRIERVALTNLPL